jgi:AP endonuclease 1
MFIADFGCQDLANAKSNWNKTPGYTEVETTAFKAILKPSIPDANKFVDVWRQLHPSDKHFSYFSYRFDCRTKNIGWRLDMCKFNSWILKLNFSTLVVSFFPVVLSERIVDRVKMCEIRSEIYGASDHCPVVMEFTGEL